MKHRFVLTSFAMLCFSSTAALSSETQNATRSYLVKYDDGTSERYIAKYSGNVEPSQTESGGPSTWNHPIDDRTCHWTITSYVKRDVCLVARTGQNYCQGQFSTIFNTSTQNQGSAFILANLASENCGQAAGRYQSDIANANSKMAADFLSTMQRDETAVRGQLQQLKGVTNVTGQ